MLIIGPLTFEVPPLQYRSMNSCIRSLPFTISQTESKGVKVHGAACVTKETLDRINTSSMRR
jgi:hypothetical protein